MLFFADSVYRFAQAGMEISTLLGHIPSETGYQPTLAAEMETWYVLGATDNLFLNGDSRDANGKVQVAPKVLFTTPVWDQQALDDNGDVVGVRQEPVGPRGHRRQPWYR